MQEMYLLLTTSSTYHDDTVERLTLSLLIVRHVSASISTSIHSDFIKGAKAFNVKTNGPIVPYCARRSHRSGRNKYSMLDRWWKHWSVSVVWRYASIFSQLMLEKYPNAESVSWVQKTSHTARTLGTWQNTSPVSYVQKFILRFVIWDTCRKASLVTVRWIHSLMYSEWVTYCMPIKDAISLFSLRVFSCVIDVPNLWKDHGK